MAEVIAHPALVLPVSRLVHLVGRATARPSRMRVSMVAGGLAWNGKFYGATRKTLQEGQVKSGLMRTSSRAVYLKREKKGDRHGSSCPESAGPENKSA